MKILLFITSLAIILGLIAQFLVTKKFPVYEKGVILMTGSNRGIGNHAALALAEKGYHVFGGARKIPSESGHKNMEYIELDVTNAEHIENAFKRVSEYCEQHKLPFVALVNNAAILFDVPLEFATDEQIRGLYDVNVFAPLKISVKFIALARKFKGRIINIGSIGGKVSPPGCGLYCSSKFSLEAITDTLRNELDQFDISVSLVEPGLVKTDMPQLREDNICKQFSPEQEKLYGKLFCSSFENDKKKMEKGASVEETTEAIVHSISSENPKTRYYVANVDGTPVSIFAKILLFIPDRVLDYMVKKF